MVQWKGPSLENPASQVRTPTAHTTRFFSQQIYFLNSQVKINNTSPFHKQRRNVPQDPGSNPSGAAGAVILPNLFTDCTICIIKHYSTTQMQKWCKSYLLSSPKPEMQGSIPCFHFFLTRQFTYKQTLSNERF